MSERGSFVTEYIYCDECLKACKKVLINNDKYLKGIVIPSYNRGKKLPIIAGKIGGMYSGEEFNTFEFDIIPEIQKLMCDDHDIRITVNSDADGSALFSFDNEKINIRRFSLDEPLTKIEYLEKKYNEIEELYSNLQMAYQEQRKKYTELLKTTYKK